MDKNILGRVPSVIRYAAVGIATGYIVLYLILAASRIQYPFELEWMEGGSVDHVRQILDGEKLYVSPSLDFVPYIYTPLYFYASAAVSKVTGVGFFPLRLVSFLASLGCFAIIFLMVRRETHSWIPSILASGLFAATYRIGGAWLDIARIDSLFLFLLLLGIYFVRFSSSVKSCIIAGALVSLAFLTKQTAAMAALPIMLYSLWRHWRLGVVLIGTVALIVGGSTVVLNTIHEGWYNYYVFKLPSEHEIVKSMYLDFWKNDLLSPLPIACMMSITLFVKRWKLSRESLIFYALVSAGLVGSSWFSRLHYGGYNNVVIPAYAGVAVLFGLASYSIAQTKLTGRGGRSKPNGSGGKLRRDSRPLHGTSVVGQSVLMLKRRTREILLYVVSICQFAILIYDPARQIPTEADMAAGRKLVEAVSRIPGDVILPSHGYLTTLAGKRSYAHGMAVGDVLRGQPGETRTKLIEEFRQAVRGKKFAAIILDSDWLPEVEVFYLPERRVFSDNSVFWPVTGMRTRPELIFVPKVDRTQ
jgi:hypothetical protein